MTQGRRPEELVEPGSALEILGQLRAHGAYQGEVLARRRDGTTFEVLVSANAVRGADGKLVNLMGSFLDVSEAKRPTSWDASIRRLEERMMLKGS